LTRRSIFYRLPRLSPDGTRVAVARQGDLYLLNLARPTAMLRLTSTPSMDWYPVWTPDSRRIVFGSWRGGGFSNLYVQDVDGGTATRLTDSPDMQLPQSISPMAGQSLHNSFSEGPARAAPGGAI
jgi:Tol biopolymer transport system component